VKRSTTQVVAAVAAVALVDDEDGVQWWQGGGLSMAAAVFNGGGYGLRIGNVEAKMVIDTSGGGWFEAKMVIDTSDVAGGDSGRFAFDGGDGRRWPFMFDCGISGQ
jgi:hypothetical protein